MTGLTCGRMQWDRKAKVSGIFYSVVALLILQRMLIDIFPDFGSNLMYVNVRIQLYFLRLDKLLTGNIKPILYNIIIG